MKPGPSDPDQPDLSRVFTRILEGRAFDLGPFTSDRGGPLGRRSPSSTGSMQRRHIKPSDDDQPEEMQGVYVISVVSRILRMHPQTLRKYERIGLLSPSRTVGMLRLYSEEDIARLRLIKHLVGDLGLNLAGVQLALNLFNQLLAMRAGLNTLEGDDLKGFLDGRLKEMVELLYTRS